MRSAHIRRSLVAVAAAGTLLLTGCSSAGGTTDNAAPVGNEVTAAPEEASGSSPDPGAAPEETEGEPEGETEGEEPTREPEPESEQVLYEAGDNSEDVRGLQARLAQTGYFRAQPTGFYGDVTTGAVAAFQEAEARLEVSGIVYASTWDLLLHQTSEPTQDELFPRVQVLGYGDNAEQVRELQARLKQLGHFAVNPTGYYGNVTTASVESYQRAAGLEVSGTVYEDTWDALTAATRTPDEDELRVPEEVPEADPDDASSLDSRCLTGRVLCVSKTANKLNWVVDGEVRLTLDVRFGMSGYETREGVFDVYWKSRNHHSTIYDSPMPLAMFFDGGQAVHYSESFRRNGWNGGSYGCVNVRDFDSLEWLFDQVVEGDKVVIYW